MLSRSKKVLLLKFLGFISVVRGYNILMIALAQYLASIYILAPQLTLREVILDENLFFLVLASTVVIAAGYIINNFYDSEKDLINKPRKTMLDRFVSQQTKLTVYFVLNFIAVFLASYVSFKAVLFFSGYIFGIWFYSHKLKKQVFIGNITSAILAITPFFIVFVYYKNFETVIFVHALFLFLLILARELIKDMENIAGDISQNYKTVPIRYGMSVAKSYITALTLATLVPAFLLIQRYQVGDMYLYFIACVFLLLLFLVLLWRAKTKGDYVWLHNILKFIIIAGVFSILLIDVSLVLNRL